MTYIVDRIEGEYAVCEDENRKMHSILVNDLPVGIKEGMMLHFENGQYTLSEPDAEKLQGIQQRMKRLWK